MVGSLPSPNKAGKARAAARLRFTKKPRTKKRSGSGVVFNYFDGRSRFFFTRGELVAVSHANPKSNLAIAQEQSAKVGLCKTAPAKHTSTFL